jgi:hypothetical protein
MKNYSPLQTFAILATAVCSSVAFAISALVVIISVGCAIAGDVLIAAIIAGVIR